MIFKCTIWLYFQSFECFPFKISAAPGVKIVPTAAGVVISQTAQVYQPHIIVQPAVQVIHIYIKSLSRYLHFGSNSPSNITLIAGVATCPTFGGKAPDGTSPRHWSCSCTCCPSRCCHRHYCQYISSLRTDCRQQHWCVFFSLSLFIISWVSWAHLTALCFQHFMINICFVIRQELLIHPRTSMTSPLATIMTLKLASTMTRTVM